MTQASKASKIDRSHRSNNNNNNPNMMLRKVLSPDITPPISDDEENMMGQSESIRETQESKDRCNKPNQEQAFQVKKKSDEPFDEAVS